MAVVVGGGEVLRQKVRAIVLGGDFDQLDLFVRRALASVVELLGTIIDLGVWHV